MNAYQFCGEYAIEGGSGKITFQTRIVNKFIKEYTYLQPEDFTKETRRKLVMFVMIPLYKSAVESLVPHEGPKEKIELPDIVFK